VGPVKGGGESEGLQTQKGGNHYAGSNFAEKKRKVVSGGGRALAVKIKRSDSSPISPGEEKDAYSERKIYGACEGKGKNT